MPISHEHNLFLSRRTLFRAAAVAALLSGGIADTATATTFSPLRPPATPLVVRSPYLTTWLAGDTLPGTWPTFWNGHITALCGIARIDGAPFVFAGNPGLPGGPALGVMTQTSVQLTATRSIYTLTAGGITLDAKGKAKLLAGEKRPFRAYGPTCDSADVLPRPVMLPNGIASGDYILFDAMGAYTVSSRSNFNGYYPDSWAVVG